MPYPNSSSQSESWLDRVIDRFKPQPPPPNTPTAPPVDRTAWEQSVDEHKVNKLTVHDVGLIVFNEMQSFADSDSANSSIGAAREQIAHAVMNADLKFGDKRDQLASTAPPIEPSAKGLEDPRTKAAYDRSLAAARNAYLKLDDPTQGATNFQFLPTPDKSNMKSSGGTTEGLPLRTQSGPFNNSYQGNDVHSNQVYVNTYGQD